MFGIYSFVESELLRYFSKFKVKRSILSASFAKLSIGGIDIGIILVILYTSTVRSILRYFCEHNLSKPSEVGEGRGKEKYFSPPTSSPTTISN